MTWKRAEVNAALGNSCLFSMVANSINREFHADYPPAVSFLWLPFFRSNRPLRLFVSLVFCLVWGGFVLFCFVVLWE